MAAADLFEVVTSSIPETARQGMKAFVDSQREALFAARSEEARLRVTNEYMRQVRDLVAKTPHRSQSSSQ